MPEIVTASDSERDKDDRLLGQLESNCDKLQRVINVAYKLFENPLTVSQMSQSVDMLIKSTEQHRKVALTINNIRHPKSTVFVKNQVNQLQLKTDKLQAQIEATKHAKMDTSSQRDPETIDIGAQAVA
jgi:uncharacterized protein YjcR